MQLSPWPMACLTYCVSPEARCVGRGSRKQGAEQMLPPWGFTRHTSTLRTWTRSSVFFGVNFASLQFLKFLTVKSSLVFLFFSSSLSLLSFPFALSLYISLWMSGSVPFSLADHQDHQLLRAGPCNAEEDAAQTVSEQMLVPAPGARKPHPLLLTTSMGDPRLLGALAGSQSSGLTAVPCSQG